MKKQYNGYRAYEYLEAGKDYIVFEVPPGVNRVPFHPVDVTPDQAQRVDWLLRQHIVIWVYLKIVIMRDTPRTRHHLSPWIFSPECLDTGSVKRSQSRDHLGTCFHPAHPTPTFALFEHGFAGAFDNPGSDRQPGYPIAGIVEAIVMKRESGLFTRHSFLSRRRQRRQGFPDGFKNPSAVMAEPVQHVIHPRVLGPVILGPDCFRHGPK